VNFLTVHNKSIPFFFGLYRSNSSQSYHILASITSASPRNSIIHTWNPSRTPLGEVGTLPYLVPVPGTVGTTVATVPGTRYPVCPKQGGGRTSCKYYGFSFPRNKVEVKFKPCTFQRYVRRNVRTRECLYLVSVMASPVYVLLRCLKPPILVSSIIFDANAIGIRGSSKPGCNRCWKCSQTKPS
jgi:hypothetical protein